jgi:hypothetical protein
VQIVGVARDAFLGLEAAFALSSDDLSSLHFGTIMFVNKARCRAYISGEKSQDERTLALFIIDRWTGELTQLEESDWPEEFVDVYSTSADAI